MSLSDEEKLAKAKAYRQAYYQRNKERCKDNARRSKLNNPELYKKLNRESMARMREADPDRFKVLAKRTRQRHQKRYTAMTYAWVQRHPGYYILRNAKSRAEKLGLPFNLTLEDMVIPEVCPVLGIALKTAAPRQGFSHNSPSIDRIIPELGYVRGNIAIISMRANDLKRNATPEELRKVAIYAHRETQRVRAALAPP